MEARLGVGGVPRLDLRLTTGVARPHEQDVAHAGGDAFGTLGVFEVLDDCSRVLTATVSTENSGRVHELMREQLPILHAHDGLVYVKLARRLVGNLEEVILFEEWRDIGAMYVWTGPHIERPRLLPGTEDLIEDLRITHYEALDVDLSAHS